MAIFTILLVSVPNLESSETESKSAKTLTKLMLVKSIIMNRADGVVTTFVPYIPRDYVTNLGPIHSSESA
jgi:hypothetical protein